MPSSLDFKNGNVAKSKSGKVAARCGVEKEQMDMEDKKHDGRKASEAPPLSPYVTMYRF